MTQPQPKTLEREKDKIYLTDREIVRRLGVPMETGLRAIKEWEGQKGAPKKQALFGGRWYWPAVEAYLWAQKNPQHQEKAPVIGHVYFLASKTAVKIGFTTRVKKRLISLRRGYPEELELLALIQNVPKSVESAAHKKFAAHRIQIPGQREWFLRCEEIEVFARDAHLGHWRKELLG